MPSLIRYLRYNYPVQLGIITAIFIIMLVFILALAINEPSPQTLITGV
ncbi:hypothetical protein [Methanobrevibacter cuticularis]|nr:hypothetical protein [Methanobrevibacter cuticularis]